MKLQFEPNQQYQLDAIQVVVDVFAGQPKNDSSVTVGRVGLGLEGQQLSLEATSARGNHLRIHPPATNKKHTPNSARKWARGKRGR